MGQRSAEERRAEAERRLAEISLRIAMERRSQALLEMLSRNPDEWFSNISRQTEHWDRQVLMNHHGAAWKKEWDERKGLPRLSPGL